MAEKVSAELRRETEIYSDQIENKAIGGIEIHEEIQEASSKLKAAWKELGRLYGGGNVSGEEVPKEECYIRGEKANPFYTEQGRRRQIASDKRKLRDLLRRRDLRELNQQTEAPQVIARVMRSGVVQKQGKKK